ncbi:VWA domain-containing protein [Methanoculleus sp. Wushi-C6]|uniref:VWA domain-containing protein n=1 Tax=Methanoculleus caldifontis TaxID=2651577 RepID=A0ABU3X0J0_9EURY|nr:VWA domain-containing protein [Methanoculleus sp. Wushi-C6]MDV2481533.1 VWA domain-containing protein [Methanoculleus sp. Wushi-C6]
MNFQKVIILMILLGLIVPAVSAGDPGQIVLSSDTAWLVANGADSAGITVRVFDGGGAPLANCTVALSVDPAFGRLTPATVTTGTSGAAVATFIANKTSGTAVITARAGGATGALEQKIDHDLPSRIVYLDYDYEVTAGDTTTITVGLADRHGNPVDGRRAAETVRFSVDSVADDAVFAGDDGTTLRELEWTVNATGFVHADLRTDRTIGENIVRMSTSSGGIDRYISIHGLATGLPAGIDLTVSPDADPVPYQPADGVSTFTLACRLSDAWGNPAAGRDLRVFTTLADEEVVLTTNSTGVACLTYGPKDSTGRLTVTATAVDNASVTASQTIEFTHTSPVEMLLSASPQSMPSRDVNPGSISELRARVVDIKGNPVAGERVTFAIDIDSIDIDGSTPVGAPCLEREGQVVATAMTGEDGYAVARFSPGSFARPMAGEQAAAKGTVTVRATWGDVSRDIALTWMNYPYLSVETEVSSGRVAVNETVDVTVRLRGDGWALQPRPIDVVLVIDRSGSMSERDVGQMRMKAAQTAAKTFIGQMSPDRDRVGLVSFSSSTRVDNRLGDPFGEVTANLDDLSASGATQLRRGIYEAILMQTENRDRPEAVKAVVVMTDGDWNYDGSPLGHGTGYPAYSSPTFSGSNLEPDKYRYYDGLGGTLKKNFWESYWTCHDGEFTHQNMSRFASDNGVKLYMITFAYRPGQTVTETMHVLASSTDGFYEHAQSGSQLTDIYERIAGELKTEAGVNTRVDLDFSTIRVNGEDREGGGVFAYIPDDEVSTAIRSWVDNVTGRYEIISLTVVNQTDDWNDDNALEFDVGTVRLGQTWEATYRLRMLADGNINIFGPNSAIIFNDGAAKLGLPDTFITAVPGLTDTGLSSTTLTLTNPRYTCAEPVLEFLTAAWDLTYTGSGTVTGTVDYSNDGGLSWIGFYRPIAGSGVTGGVASLDVGNLPPGEYRVRVRASAEDAPESWLLFPPIRVGEPQAAYIRIV